MQSSCHFVASMICVDKKVYLHSISEWYWHIRWVFFDHVTVKITSIIVSKD
jgi:hypothetical protein